MSVFLFHLSFVDDTPKKNHFDWKKISHSYTAGLGIYLSRKPGPFLAYSLRCILVA
jgi:hypothetical protein